MFGVLDAWIRTGRSVEEILISRKKGASRVAALSPEPYHGLYTYGAPIS
jgi:hypothetical protein